MRWSQLHIPTLREDPADADAASHRLLLRAGFIRQLMAGHYSLLPLGVRVRTKVIAVIRDEMNRIGAQEFLLPSMQPAQIWEKSGRIAVMGEEMFKFKDRRGQLTVLGMTHEEIFATLAIELASYRELPQFWYQFQTKFRDEPRPKSGLIRVREFTMKDSYSFDLDEAGLDVSFDAHRSAYERIFARLGIPAFGVEASNGTMGGSDSVEFMCPSKAGEDVVAKCPDCGYAANLEKATSSLAAIEDPSADAAPAAPVRLDTPGVRTIEDLVTTFGLAADRQIKTLVQVIDGKLTLVLLRGDHPLSDQKLIDATGAVSVRPAQPDEISDALGALPGSLGAVGVTEFPVIADEALRGRRDMATGANTDDVHLTGVDVERDIPAITWADLREVSEGEPCPRCGAALEFVHAVEVGHIFKLGRKFTTALGVTVAGPDGGSIIPIMGSYGIGVERAIAAVAEVHHDDAGLVWPVQVAPFEAAVLPLSSKDAEVKATAEMLYGSLLDEGVEAVIDDRDVRPGVKYADVELIGIPYRVSVGARDLADGVVEVTSRSTGEKERVPVGQAAARLRELLAR
ncbi:MAG TPA: proline--tRNA ligase [Streptosporangiaceae bacterium]|jgi:prolyl-tRNA synthetase family II|nr:proline--tRNA ligase [Streptosporangiaceae bacterium]